MIDKPNPSDEPANTSDDPASTATTPPVTTDIPFDGRLTWSQPPRGPSGSYELVFQDNFLGTAFDTRLWSPNLWWNGVINWEKQAYRPENCIVENGHLVLRAERRQAALWWTEKVNNPWRTDPPVYMNYASGMLHTLGKYQVSVGEGIVVEARMKVCQGQGLWSAFWMMSADKTLPQPRPEIDVIEILNNGLKIDEKIANFHYHSVEGSLGSKHFYDKSLHWSYHTFTALWTKEGISWFVDGQPRGTPWVGPTYQGAMHLIVNLAVGGSWPGDPSAETHFPADTQIDYVKVWKRTAV